MNARQLKLIAIVSMLFDHIGLTLNAIHRYNIEGAEMMNVMSDAYNSFRMIGRLSFPIFAFLIAEGCAHTHDIKAYRTRLFFFGLLSQIPYQAIVNLASGRPDLWHYSNANVLLTFTLGVVAVECYKKLLQNPHQTLLWSLGILGTFITAIVFQTEYSIVGIGLILGSYLLRPKTSLDLDKSIIGAKSLQVLVCGLMIVGYYQLYFSLFSPYTIGAIFAIITLGFYNGKPGKRRGKLGFYVFYPLHLTGLAFIMYQVMT